MEGCSEKVIEHYTFYEELEKGPREEVLKRWKEKAKQDPAPFFMSRKRKPYPDMRWYKERYAKNYSQYLLRGESRNWPYCWINEQWTRDPKEPHTTARLGASERWGVEKQGNRTTQHFIKQEDPKRFLPIEMYRRPCTNEPGIAWMDYGRPTRGFYLQRNPHTYTWFGAKIPLNRTQTLQDIYPKTSDMYDAMKRMEVASIKTRKDKWPAYSQYTDSYACRTRSEPIMTPLERRKLHIEEARREAAKAVS